MSTLHDTSQPSHPADESIQYNITQEGVKLKDLHEAHVTLLDGRRLGVQVHKNADGEVLFNLVTNYIGLIEKDYFSLAFYEQPKLRKWLYKNKKISKQVKDLPWEFTFEVKFYVPDPSKLSEDFTRHLFTLQLRMDLYEARLPATFLNQAYLGSLIAQAELGDYNPECQYHEALRGLNIVQNMKRELADKIIQLYKDQKGKQPPEAEASFLMACREVSMYGMAIYEGKERGKPVRIGINASGISVFNEQLRIHYIIWQSMHQLEYQRKSFTVKLKQGEKEGKSSLTFKLEDEDAAKRCWKTAVEHHTFFRLVQPEDKRSRSMLKFGSGQFHHEGRTLFQTQMASQMFDQTSGPQVSTARLINRSADSGTHPAELTSPTQHHIDDSNAHVNSSTSESHHVTTMQSSHAATHNGTNDEVGAQFYTTSTPATQEQALSFHANPLFVSTALVTSDTSISSSRCYTVSESLSPSQQQQLQNTQQNIQQITQQHQPKLQQQHASFRAAPTLLSSAWFAMRQKSVVETPKSAQNGEPDSAQFTSTKTVVSPSSPSAQLISESGEQLLPIVREIKQQILTTLMSLPSRSHTVLAEYLSTADTSHLSPQLTAAYRNLLMANGDSQMEAEVKIRSLTCSRVYCRRSPLSPFSLNTPLPPEVDDALKTRSPSPTVRFDESVNHCVRIVGADNETSLYQYNVSAAENYRATIRGSFSPGRQGYTSLTREEANETPKRSIFGQRKRRRQQQQQTLDDSGMYSYTEETSKRSIFGQRKRLYHRQPFVRVETPVVSLRREGDLQTLPIRYYSSIYSSGLYPSDRRFVEHERHAGEEEIITEFSTDYYDRHLSRDVEYEPERLERDLEIEPENLQSRVKKYHSGQAQPKRRRFTPSAPKSIAILHMRNRRQHAQRAQNGFAQVDLSPIPREGQPPLAGEEGELVKSKKVARIVLRSVENQPLDSSQFAANQSARAGEEIGPEITISGPTEALSPDSEIADTALENCVTLCQPTTSEGIQKDVELSSEIPLQQTKISQKIQKKQLFKERKEKLKTGRGAYPSIDTAQFEGPLDELAKEGEVEMVPIRERVSVYYTEQTPEKETKSPKKSKNGYPSDAMAYSGQLDELAKEGEVEMVPIRERVTVYYTEQTPEKEAKSPKKSKNGYPSDATPFEGPVETLKTEGDVEMAPIREVVTLYYDEHASALQKDESPKEKARMKKTGYPIDEMPFEGPLESIKTHDDVEMKPLKEHVALYEIQQKDASYKSNTRSARSFDSTPFEGPVELLAKEEHAEISPINEHVNLYAYEQKPPKTRKSKEDAVILEAQPLGEIEKLAKRTAHIRMRKEIESAQLQQADPSQTKTRTSWFSRKRLASEDPLQEDILAEAPDKKVAKIYLKSKLEEGEQQQISADRKTSSETPEKSDGGKQKKSSRYLVPQIDESALKLEPHTELDGTPLETCVDVCEPSTSGENARLVEQKRKEPKPSARIFLKTREAIDAPKSLFGFLRSSKQKESSGAISYPQRSEPFDGVLEKTVKESEMDVVPLRSEVSTYHSGYSLIVRNRHYKFFTRERHEGDEETVEVPDKSAYGSLTLFPFGDEHETLQQTTEIEHLPIRALTNIYHSGLSKSKKSEDLGDAEEMDSSDEPDVVAAEKSLAKIFLRPAKVSEEVREERKRSFFDFGKRRKRAEKDEIFEASVMPAVGESYSGPLESLNCDVELDSGPIDEHVENYSSIRRQYPTKSTLLKKEADDRAKEEAQVSDQTLIDDGGKRLARIVVRSGEMIEPQAALLAAKRSPDEIQKVSEMPAISEPYTGQLEDLNREFDVESSPIEESVENYKLIAKYPSKLRFAKQLIIRRPKEAKNVETPVVVNQKSLARIVARSREVVEEPQSPSTKKSTKSEKSQSKVPEIGESYEGEVESLRRDADLDKTPIEEQVEIQASIPHYPPKSQKSKTVNEQVEEIAPAEKSTAKIFLKTTTQIDEPQKSPKPTSKSKQKVSQKRDFPVSEAYAGPVESLEYQANIDPTSIREHVENIYPDVRRNDVVSEAQSIETHHKTAIIHLRSAEIEIASPEAVQEKRTSFLGFLSRGKEKSEEAASSISAYPAPLEFTNENVDVTSKSVELLESPLSEQVGLYEIRPYSPKQKSPVRKLEENKYPFDESPFIGELELVGRDQEIEHLPISEHSTIYYASPSSPAKSRIPRFGGGKEKRVEVLEESPESKQIAHIHTRTAAEDGEEEEASDQEASDQEAPDLEKEGTRFFDYLKTKKSKAIGEKTTVMSRYQLSTDKYEGELEALQKEEDLSEDPLATHVTVYYDEQLAKTLKLSEKARPASAYPLDLDAYQGPIDQLARGDEISSDPLKSHVNVYYDETLAKLKSDTKKLSAEKDRPTNGYPLDAEAFTGPLDLLDKEEELHTDLLASHVNAYYDGSPSKSPPKPKRERRKIAVEKDRINGYPIDSEAYSGHVDLLDLEGEMKNQPLDEVVEISESNRLAIEKPNKRPSLKTLNEEVEGPPAEHKLTALIHVKSEESSPMGESENDTPTKKSFGFLRKRAGKAERTKTEEAKELPTTNDVVDEEDLAQTPPTVATLQESPSTSSSPSSTHHKKFRIFMRAKGAQEAQNNNYPEDKGVFDGEVDILQHSANIEELPIRNHVAVYYDPRLDQKRRFKIPRIGVLEKRPKTSPDEHDENFASAGEEIVEENKMPLANKRTARLFLRNIENIEPIREQPEQQRSFFAVVRNRGSPPKDTPSSYPTDQQQYLGALEALAKNEEILVDPDVKFAKLDVPYSSSKSKHYHVFLRQKHAELPARSEYGLDKNLYSGPLENLGKNEEFVEDVNVIKSADVPYSSSSKQTQKLHVFLRERHEGEESIEDADLAAYNFDGNRYEGEVEPLGHEGELEGGVLSEHINHAPKPPAEIREVRPAKLTALLHLKRQLQTELEVRKKQPKTRPSPRKSAKLESYPPHSEAYVGELENLGKNEELLHDTNIITAADIPYSSSPAASKSAQKLRIFLREKHEGEESIEDADLAAYNFDRTAFEGEVEPLGYEGELEGGVLSEHVEISPKVPLKIEEIREVRPNKMIALLHLKRQPEAELEIREKPTKSRPSPRKSKKLESYPPYSEAYAGELENLGKNEELLHDTNIITAAEVPHISPAASKSAKKLHVFLRERHEGEESIEDANLAAYNFDTTTFGGEVEPLGYEGELEGGVLSEHLEISPKVPLKIEETQEIRPNKMTALLHLKRQHHEETSNVTPTSWSLLKKRKQKEAKTTPYPSVDIEQLRVSDELKKDAEIVEMPNIIITPADSESTSEPYKQNLRIFLRERYEGEESVEEANLSSYNFDQTPFEGEIEGLERDENLEIVELAETVDLHHDEKPSKPADIKQTPPKKPTALLHLKKSHEEIDGSTNQKSGKSWSFLKKSRQVNVKTESYPLDIAQHAGPVEDLTKNAEFVEDPNVVAHADVPYSSPAASKSAKKLHVFLRERHEGEESIEDADLAAYNFDRTAFEGEIEGLQLTDELERTSLVGGIDNSYETEKSAEIQEVRPKKLTALLHLRSQPEIPSKSRTSAQKEVRKAYPSDVEQFSGLLDPLNKDAELVEDSEIVTTYPAKSPQKLRIFLRERHEGEESVEDANLSAYNFDTTTFEGQIEQLNRDDHLERTSLVGRINSSYDAEKSAEIHEDPRKKLTALLHLKKQTPPTIVTSKSWTFLRAPKQKGNIYQLNPDVYSGQVGDLRKEVEFTEDPTNIIARSDILYPASFSPKQKYRMFMREKQEETAYALDKSPFSGELDPLERAEDLQSSALSEHVEPSTEVVYQMETEELRPKKLTALLHLKSQAQLEEQEDRPKTQTKSGWSLLEKRKQTQKSPDPFPANLHSYPEEEIEQMRKEEEFVEDLDITAPADVPYPKGSSPRRFRALHIFSRQKHEGEESVGQIDERNYNFESSPFEAQYLLSREEHLDNVPISEHVEFSALKTPEMLSYEQRKSTALLTLRDENEEQEEEASPKLQESRKRGILALLSSKSSPKLEKEPPSYPPIDEPYLGELELMAPDEEFTSANIFTHNDVPYPESNQSARRYRFFLHNNKSKLGAERIDHQKTINEGYNFDGMRFEGELQPLAYTDNLNETPISEHVDYQSETLPKTTKEFPTISTPKQTALIYVKSMEQYEEPDPTLRANKKRVKPQTWSILGKRRRKASSSHRTEAVATARRIDYSDLVGGMMIGNASLFSTGEPLTDLQADLFLRRHETSQYHVEVLLRDTRTTTFPTLFNGRRGPKFLPRSLLKGATDEAQLSLREPPPNPNANKPPPPPAPAARDDGAEADSSSAASEEEVAATPKRHKLQHHRPHHNQQQQSQAQSTSTQTKPKSNTLLASFRQQLFHQVGKESSAKNESKRTVSSLSSSDSEVEIEERHKIIHKKHDKSSKRTPTERSLSNKGVSTKEDNNKMFTTITSNFTNELEKESSGPYFPANDQNDGPVIRRERVENVYRIRGTGEIPRVDPTDPQTSPPHTTLQTWHEKVVGPEQVTTEVDEHGNLIKKTIKSEQVKHTVQKQTYQSYSVDDDNNQSHSTPNTLNQTLDSIQTINSSIPANLPSGQAQTRVLVYGRDGELRDAQQNEQLDENQIVTSKTVTTGNRTIETITYKTIKDGVVQTNVEHRVTITGPEVDQDAELRRAIAEATGLNPKYEVQRIEIKEERLQ